MRPPITPVFACPSRRESAFWTHRLLLLILLVVVLAATAQMPMPKDDPAGVTPVPHGPTYQAESTKKMAALLQRIYQASDWKTDPTKQAERARYYSALLQKKPLSLPDEATIRQQLAIELLGAGDSAAAVDTLEALRRRSADIHQPLPPAAERKLGETLGLAYLRLGEQQNCMAHRGQKSCIFPIRAGGVHQLTRGAEGAVREFTALLDRDPHDDGSRWLLNVASMQLGQYPAKVPPKYLAPASLFASDFALPEFDDIALTAGVDLTSHAGGAILEDFDGDGRLDLMVTSSSPLDPMHLFHNDGGTGAQLHFTDITALSGLVGETGGLNLVVTDYNNDGRPDVLVLRGGWWGGAHGAYPMSLLRNNGVHNGQVRFEDVTVQAGLMSLHPTQTASWADFDNDGWLDLFVGHESTPDDPHPSQLFHNNHDGTFTEVGPASGIPADLGFVKGVAWGDFNNDGRPDLYVSVKGGRNKLFRNDGARPGGGWRFTEIAAQAGVDTQRNSFATWFFDYDNDGWPDLFVAGYATETPIDVGAFELGHPFHAELPRLYRNRHDGTFEDVTRKLHLDRAILPMGANFGDLDNDGWLDVYLGTGESLYQSLLPNRMFRNNGGKGFEDVTTAGGFGHLQKGHAVAFGDLEGNGNEDIFEEMGGAFPGDTYQSILYRNPGSGGHSLTLLLEGVQTNRPAFGARICVTVGARRIFRTVGFGSSFGGNPLRQHIGLGAATVADRIEVFWPTTGRTQSFTHVAADRSYHLREGDATLSATASFRAWSPSAPALR